MRHFTLAIMLLFSFLVSGCQPARYGIIPYIEPGNDLVLSNNRVDLSSCVNISEINVIQAIKDYDNRELITSTLEKGRAEYSKNEWNNVEFIWKRQGIFNNFCFEMRADLE